MPPPACTDRSQIAILHFQYAVIIFRLNIDYPSAVMVLTSAASTLTWAGGLLDFSPSCLVPGLDSGRQATAQLLGSLLTPCAVVVASVGVWALR